MTSPARTRTESRLAPPGGSLERSRALNGAQRPLGSRAGALACVGVLQLLAIHGCKDGAGAVDSAGIRTTLASSDPEPSVPTDAAAAKIAAGASASMAQPSAQPSEALSARPLARLFAGQPAPDVRLGEPKEISEHEPTARASIRGPEGWIARGHNNGASDEVTAAVTLRAPDDSAIVVLATHGTHVPSLLDYGAAEWFGMSGGVHVVDFEQPPVPGELGEKAIPVLLLKGRGTFGHAPAALYQARYLYRHHPDSGEGADLVLGAIKQDAPPQRFAELVAAMASFEPYLLGRGAESQPTPSSPPSSRPSSAAAPPRAEETRP